MISDQVNDQRKATILIIDDDPFWVDKLLVTHGYNVASVRSMEGVKKWLVRVQNGEAASADLILLDLVIPEVDGVAMYRWLQTEEITANVPVIVLTAVDTIAKRVECLSLGANDYIVKPFSADELFTRIIVHLRVSELQAAKTAAEAQVATQAGFLSAIHAISNKAAQYLNLTHMLNDVASQVSDIFNCLSCTFYLYQPDSEELKLAASSSKERLNPIVPDLVEVAINQAYSIAFDTETAVPIMRDDVMLGVIYILNTAENKGNQDMVDALEILAAQLSTAITNTYLFQDIRQHNVELDTIAKENARLLQNEQQRREQAEQLHQMSQLISSSLDMNHVLIATVESLKMMIHVEAGSIFLLDKDKKRLSFTGSLSQADAELANHTIPADKGIVGRVVQTGQAIIANDVQTHPLFFPAIDDLTGRLTRSILCVPLVARSEVIGAIELINKTDDQFTDHLDLNLVESAAASIAIALDNAQLYQEQKDFVNQIAHSQEQLLQSEKMAATGRLAASLAHEINNPLQAIHSCLQLAVHFDLPPEKQDEYLGMANEEVERLIDIVSRILDFSRPSPSKLERVDINKVVRQVMRLTHKHMVHGKLEIKQSLATDLPLIQLIPDQIAQAFLSIILNAFDAMPDGGELLIETRRNQNEVEVSFQDMGIGMTPDIQSQIFEPFFTTKKERSGLGLTVGYGIIERHGGHIHINTIPYGGTTVRVHFPIKYS